MLNISRRRQRAKKTKKLERNEREEAQQSEPRPIPTQAETRCSRSCSRIRWAVQSMSRLALAGCGRKSVVCAGESQCAADTLSALSFCVWCKECVCVGLS